MLTSAEQNELHTLLRQQGKLTQDDCWDVIEVFNEFLLAQPEIKQEPVAWIETKGKAPHDWEDYEYIWTHWKSGRISLDEAYGCWSWDEVTHWMPANIIEPSKPR
jgi:hypothetical protein